MAYIFYIDAAEAEKSYSSYRKKRRGLRTPQVSTDPAEYIRKQIGKLDLNDITTLARLIDGHDANDAHASKQKELQEQILALLDPEDTPDPKVLRETLSNLLQGTTKSQVRNKEKAGTVMNYFNQQTDKPTKPPRRLKGLDASTIKVPDFSDIFQDSSADTDATLVGAEYKRTSPKFTRSASTETPKLNRTSSIESPLRGRRLSEVLYANRNRSSQSPEVKLQHRSNSIDSPETVKNTKRIALMFEGQSRRSTPSPESRTKRSSSISTPEMMLRCQRMAQMIEGKHTSSPERTKLESIGNRELAARRQRMHELIHGQKPRETEDVREDVRRSELSDMQAFRLQRVSEMMQKRAEGKKKSGGRRKAARVVMKQRFEKSLQMLAAEPRMEFASADLDNDYGLQQYRASAPHFGERVKTLEKQLQHYVRFYVVWHALTNRSVV